MIQYMNECCDCGKPCFGYCPLKMVPHYFCDKCEEETQLYEFDGEDLCLNCIESLLTRVN